MTSDSKLALKLGSKDFIVTAECQAPVGTSASFLEGCAKTLQKGITAVNLADNHHGVALSSLAAAVVMLRSGLEPVYQVVTRDRNRIALQSDLLGASLLGIKNILCLSGYHQALMGCPESANVYDIDSIQLIAAVKKMNEGSLLNGLKIEGAFSMLIGAAANPYLKPMELNMLRLKKKVAAGAGFIQTQAIFDIEGFRQWLETAVREGLTDKTAILAGVMPLSSADEGQQLADRYTDLVIPPGVLERIKSAGNPAAQKKEGLSICVDTIKKLKSMKGLRGVHILSGGNEASVPEIIAAADL